MPSMSTTDDQHLSRTPTYAIRSSYAYVHQVPDPVQGSDYEFQSKGDSIRIYNVPVFYWPALSGTISNDFPLREFNVGNAITEFGTTRALSTGGCLNHWAGRCPRIWMSIITWIISTERRSGRGSRSEI